MTKPVLDTNVLVAALRSEGGAAREVLRRSLKGRYRPLFGNALWLEYEDLLGRDVWAGSGHRQPGTGGTGCLSRGPGVWPGW
ncbi:MAG: PIN domain-containing protein [Candidatus Competibacteraceae bacterium]|nr:PIN domain-containing protein [Candidatus Competibacteraceae bacterium]